MHNMIIKAQMEKYEMEDGTMYNIVDDSAVTENNCDDNGDDDSIHSGGCLIDGAVNRGFWHNSTKFKMVHNWWEDQYDFE